jgi:hypothetical protein
MFHHVTRAAAMETAYDVVCKAAVHGDVPLELAEKLSRMVQSPQLCNDRFLIRIAKRSSRLMQLRPVVEALPDSLDTRGRRLVDVQSLASAWLDEQFQVFGEQMRSSAAP